MEVRDSKPFISTDSSTDYIQYDNVRICPSPLSFSGAYDGKKFDETFRIINVGVRPSFVRICPTTSKAFKMKPLPNGTILSAGMSLIRHVTYTFNSANAIPQAFIYIYINEKPILYPIDVQVGISFIKITPRVLNFGEIDVGTSSEKLSMFFKNLGQRIAHYTLDLGRNDLELIVNPMTGSIKPGQEQEVTVEILGSRIGEFTKEFWVKSEPLQRVWITGTFIQPNLKIEHPFINDFELIVIDFPKTYYNAQNSKTVIIKNSSSVASMFCTVVEYKMNVDIKLDEARELCPDLKFFQLNPVEGRLLKNRKAIATVTFAPYRLKTFPQKYCTIFIKIMKINYRDATVTQQQDVEAKTFSNATEADQYQITDDSEESAEVLLFDVKWDANTTYLRLCLYGEIEEVKVKVTPSAIERNNLNVNEESRLTFNIKNDSKHLPITFKYEKVACLDMHPSEATLEPESSIDILLKLTPHSIGKYVKNINLVLYYKNRDGNVYKVGNAYLRIDYAVEYNRKPRTMTQPKYIMGISSPYVNDVGHLVDVVRYDTANINEVPVQAFINNTKMSKCLGGNNSNLIAFPNDRPKWSQWRNKRPCTTIFTQLPRYVTPTDYNNTYTKSEWKFRNENRKKYIDFMENRADKKIEKEHKAGEGQYPESESKVLLTNGKSLHCSSPFATEDKCRKLAPLTPTELMDILITPRYVNLGKIAPHIDCSDFFEIINNNIFPITIAIVALSSSIIVKGKKRIKILGNKSAKLYFDCFSHGLGDYYVPVYIIINDYHIFDGTIFAEVVPTTVKCKLKEVMIDAKDNVAYLELFNPVNCAIDFAWDVQETNYEVMPKDGKIESRKTLYCKIVFTPKVDSVFRTEMYLLSQSGAKHIVKVCNQTGKSFVKFSQQTIEMKHTPLNITVSKRLVVRNETEQAIVLHVKDSNPIEQIKITPTEGFLEGKCDIFFKITAHFKTIKSFSCIFEFVLLDGREYIINVYGNVTFPNVIFEPEFMHIPKIITSAYQRRVFRISNSCWSTTTIKFLLDNYPDLTVTDLSRKKIENVITLAPKDYVELYLEFQPTEPTAYTLYLPYIINDFLGPPLLNNPKSFNIGTYLEPPAPDITRTMSTLRITCAAGAPWFKFSQFKLELDEEQPEKTFRVTNISSSFHQLKFFIDNLESFKVNVISCTGKYKTDEKFIKVSLESNEKVVLGFTFNVDDYGVYEDYIPVFVSNYFENCPFNYIRLRGSKYRPVIESKTKMIMMPTIPVKKIYVTSVKLQLRNHRADCCISSETNNDFLKIEMKHEKKALEITVIFSPKWECNVIAKVILTCTCNASYTIYVTAACDNCSLLSYRHKMKCWTDRNNPLEHQDIDFGYHNESFLKKLNKLNEILEKYVFSQGFFLTYYYRIPATISKYPYTMYSVPTKSQKPWREKIVHLPIVNFFKNLCYPGIVYNFIDGVNSGSTDDRQGAVYDYGVYKNILKYLEDYEVFVKNLNPELLLNYERYIVFKTQLIDEENMSGDEILPEEEFNFLSKQCWLDLLLKIYKLLHYDRLLKDIPPKTGRLEVDDIYSEEFANYYSSQIESFPPDVNECEAKIMLWLEYHFKEQKDKLWPSYNIPSRTIRDLSNDVRDSLPLATIIAAYCPYLSDIFRDIYLEETDITGSCPLHHNACLVSEAWNRLNLSFKIATNNIFEPTNTEMLFLLSYLYIVLPSFYPLETVTIKSHLGKTSSVKVILKNTGPATISYTPKLFLNDNESFQISSDHILIPYKGERELVVSYTAKQIIKEEAVLVLSGETAGEKFSKSMAINLIGIPDILYFTQEFKIRMELYQTASKTINVFSPYAQAYYATTYFYLFQEEKPPLTMKDFVSVTNVPGLPRQLELEGVCAFEDDGMHKLTISMCFVTLGEWIYYIYFLNKDVGIFSIKISIHAEQSANIYDTILVKIHTNFDPSAPCKCKSHSRNLLCPRILYADLPCQNKDLLDGLRNMIKIYARPDEIEFWNTHLVFSKGFHIFRTYLENTYQDDLVPFKKVLHPAVSYNTKTEDKRFSVEPTLHFEDVTSEGNYKLIIHWDSCDMPVMAKLYLLAQHGLEPRNYILTFWGRETISEEPRMKKRSTKRHSGRKSTN